VYSLQSQKSDMWNRVKEEPDHPPELNKLQQYILRGPLVMQKLGECSEQDILDKWLVVLIPTL